MAHAMCSVPGCPHQARSRGWCQTHYNRWALHGDVGADRPINVRRKPAAPGEICEVPDCSRPMRHRPWCEPHHVRWLKHGDVQADKPIKTFRGPLGTVPCSVATCRNASRTRGWCSAHYRRWIKNGTPAEEVELLPVGVPPAERFWSKIDKGGPRPPSRPSLGRCYLWTGPVNSAGYGAFAMNGVHMGAHHAGWLLGGGHAFLPGLVLDHLCGVRRCVRKSHLDPVPQHINMQRSVDADAASSETELPQCSRGHVSKKTSGRCARCCAEDQRALRAELRFTASERGPRLVMTDELAEEIAEVYTKALDEDSPPLIAVGKHFRRSRGQSGALIKFARSRGFIAEGSSFRTRRSRPVLPVGDRVYFVERQGFVKIGFTKNLNKRLSALPREVIRVDGMRRGPVVLLASQPGSTALERRLHRRFAHLHAGGEWFRHDDELQALIEQVAAGAVAAA